MRKSHKYGTYYIFQTNNIQHPIPKQKYIEKLLNYFKDRKDVNILIRPHPAEKIFENKNNIQDLYCSNLENENFEIANGDSAVEVIRILEMATNSLMGDR